LADAPWPFNIYIIIYNNARSVPSRMAWILHREGAGMDIAREGLA